MPQDNKILEVNIPNVFGPETVTGDFDTNQPDSNFDRILEIRDLFGLLQTITSAPTYVPKKFSEQVVLAVAGGANSLYVYDVLNNKWRAASLGT